MEKPIKYFAYLRKSSEGKEKQALSIPAQKDALLNLFPGLDIEIIEEERSAFKPYNRPLFDDMVKRIQKGERQGVLVWAPDRLSRNEIDAATITYMIRREELKDLKFATYHFDNSPEGIWMLQMALSQSQYESAKKGRDVKRGVRMKAKTGDYPAYAPLGYLNDPQAERGKKKVLIDTERFAMVRKMWDMMLSGKFTPPQILKIATCKWGLRTRHKKGGGGGKKLSRSNIYHIFSNEFYYGKFEYPKGSGQWHDGNHKAMITKDEFERVQVLLGRKDRPRPKTHEFAYRGFMTCGNCKAAVTAERKYKKLASGGVKSFIYYHCTHRKDISCKQGSVEEKELERQIVQDLARYEVPPEFKKWGLGVLREMEDKESAEDKAIVDTQKREHDACIRKLDVLIDMRANGEISEDEFRAKKATLSADKERLGAAMAGYDSGAENWLDIAERGFDFAMAARMTFENDKSEDYEVRKEVLSTVGSNHEVLDKKLNVKADILLLPLAEAQKILQAQNTRLEPRNPHAIQGDLMGSDLQTVAMLRWLDEVRTCLIG